MHVKKQPRHLINLYIPLRKKRQNIIIYIRVEKKTRYNKNSRNPDEKIPSPIKILYSRVENIHILK